MLQETLFTGQLRKDELLKEYSHRMELHAHSMPVSPCCSCPNERFLELYAKKQVKTICLTNHFDSYSLGHFGNTKKEAIDAYVEGYERLKELAKPYGIQILLGCEIKFNENANDYLIYGVNREILEEAYDYLDKGVALYREQVSLKDSLFIQAHPFRNNMVLTDMKYLDGMETMNFHPNHNGRCSSSARYAKEKGIAICIGGSDFHENSEYHDSALLTLSKEAPTDSFDLARLLKRGDYLFLLGDHHVILP